MLVILHFHPSILHLSLPCCWHGMYQVALLSFSFRMDSANGDNRKRWIDRRWKCQESPSPTASSVPQLYISGSSCFLQTAPMGKPFNHGDCSSCQAPADSGCWQHGSLPLSLKPKEVNHLPLFLVVKYFRSHVCAFTPSIPL